VFFFLFFSNEEQRLDAFIGLKESQEASNKTHK